MSAQSLRQPQAIRRYQTTRIDHLRAIERSWSNPAPNMAWIAPPRKSRWALVLLAFQKLMDRSAEASWRLHDGVPAVWTLVGVIVLTASAAATVCIAATAFGYQP
jgi:hypothetical protein